MAGFKELHKKWKKAKDDAKGVYERWTSLYMSVGNDNVDYGTPAWPKFNMDLGPSLDKLESKKDVDKNKLKALKAVKQYKTDIENFIKAANKTEVGSKDKELRRGVLITELNKLEKVREEIAETLEK